MLRESLVVSCTIQCELATCGHRVQVSVRLHNFCFSHPPTLGGLFLSLSRRKVVLGGSPVCQQQTSCVIHVILRRVFVSLEGWRSGPVQDSWFQKIVSHPQQEAVQNDLEQQQSFNAFSNESKVAIMDAGNTEICEIVNVEPKWQCKVCLKHWSAGIVYCTCGHLMTNDSAESRKYISALLDTFSIPNFYIRKNRPHGHRHGKAPGCKDYFTANQLAKKCREEKYDSIHDRYIRDKTQEVNG